MVSAPAVALALAVDAITGEPPRRMHPVAWFGSMVSGVDRDWTHPRAVGLAIAVFAPAIAAAAVGTFVVVTATVSIPAAVVVAGLVLYVTTSRRMLVGQARSVVRSSEGNLERAREALPALVGRDTTSLSPAQGRSAAVESAAENLSDGLVAPLVAFSLGALLGGALGPVAALGLAATGATWIKAVNTLDSMIGYPTKPVGWPSARLDDVAMWVPARVTAVVIALVSGRPRALLEARRWLTAVASPNAGWPMGTVAAVVDCRLEKPGAYVINGEAPLPSVETALDAIHTVNRAAIAAYVLATFVAALEVLAWS